MSVGKNKRFTLLPEDHTVMVSQTSRWGQIILLTLVSVGATAFGTSWFYRIDEIITARGKLIPQYGGVEVKSPVNGRLASVLVKNGESVEKQQQLIIFDVESAKNQERTLNAKLKLEKERSKKRLKSNEQRQITLGRNIALSNDILERLKKLQMNGAISDIQILQQQNRLEKERDELLQLKNTQSQVINESNLRITEIEGNIDQIKNILRNEIMRAPISGVIFGLKPDNDNYVTTNAEPLLQIVPMGKLNAAVSIGNQDIGFISPGQKVKVRVDSFPFTEYGELQGTISRIGADALPPTQLVKQTHFPVDIKLATSSLKTKDQGVIPLQAGMTVTTNIKLRDRRLIELLSDIFVNRGESLNRLRQP